MKEMKTAMEKLDIMVVIDPYPTVSAVLADPSQRRERKRDRALGQNMLELSRSFLRWQS